MALKQAVRESKFSCWRLCDVLSKIVSD